MVRIGVSACLLGDPVRYDGRDRAHVFVRDTLADHVELVRVCPEVELGLGVPREPIRLVASSPKTRLVSAKGVDLTARMASFADSRVRELDDLCGYVFKARSPSCAVDSAQLSGTDEKTAGMFAAALRLRHPTLPVVEEEALDDPFRRHDFLMRAFANARLASFLSGAPAARDRVRFQQDEKYLLMAFAPSAQKEIGRGVAAGQEYDAERFRQAFAAPTTVGRHVNALSHVAGYFSPNDFEQDIQAFAESGKGLLSLLRRMRRAALDRDVTYLVTQSYLAPFPAALE